MSTAGHSGRVLMAGASGAEVGARATSVSGPPADVRAPPSNAQHSSPASLDVLLLNDPHRDASPHRSALEDRAVGYLQAQVPKPYCPDTAGPSDHNLAAGRESSTLMQLTCLKVVGTTHEA